MNDLQALFPNGFQLLAILLMAGTTYFTRIAGYLILRKGKISARIEKTLYVKLNSGKDLVITVPGYHQYEVGEKHNFGFDLGALHFFDAETELRIN